VRSLTPERIGLESPFHKNLLMYHAASIPPSVDSYKNYMLDGKDCQEYREKYIGEKLLFRTLEIGG
jgi:hypothetical protein